MYHGSLDRGTGPCDVGASSWRSLKMSPRVQFTRPLLKTSQKSTLAATSFLARKIAGMVEYADIGAGSLVMILCVP